MTKHEQAIKYFEEQLKVLDDHRKRGGEFAAEALEHTKTAIEALRKQVPRAALAAKCPACGEFVDREYDYCDCGQALDWQATDCIQITCEYCCYPDNKNIVCPRYADKVDEIRRIHEEDGND
jgi:hypothetical protein